MSLLSLQPGPNPPKEIYAIIEIPSHGDPVKYEIEKTTGAMMVDRFLSTSMRYPCNYGYMPHSLAEDGDPADILVVTPYPLITGAVIRVRPIGMLRMTDEAGVDAKILTVPITKLSQDYAHINSIEDFPEAQLATISHFFEHYKDLEKNKWVKVEGWLNAAAAEKEILDSIERYKA